MKRKAKDLEQQIAAKDAELAKLKEKMSEKAQDDMKLELRRAYEVLRHLKKKVGNNAYTEEYRMIMSDIKEALHITSGSPARKQKHSRVQAPEARLGSDEPLNIEAIPSSGDGEYVLAADVDSEGHGGDATSKEPEKLLEQEGFWGQNILPFLALRDLGRVQQLDRKFYLMMQPKSDRCQVDYNAVVGVDVAAKGLTSLEQVANAILKPEPEQPEGEEEKKEGTEG